MKIPNKLYDVLKWISLVALNAIGVCYKSIAMIWHLPYGTEVLATCSAIALCIGTLIGISTVQYNKAINSDIKAIEKDLLGDEDE